MEKETNAMDAAPPAYGSGVKEAAIGVDHTDCAGRL